MGVVLGDTSNFITIDRPKQTNKGGHISNDLIACDRSINLLGIEIDSMQRWSFVSSTTTNEPVDY